MKMNDPKNTCTRNSENSKECAYDEDNIRYLSGSMLYLHPASVVPQQWLENYELCVEYRRRFGMPVSLPFWFVNGMDRAKQLLRESLDLGRRRWILECGPWASNPPIECFSDIISASGRSLNSLSLEDTANLWLEPFEWIEHSIDGSRISPTY